MRAYRQHRTSCPKTACTSFFSLSASRSFCCICFCMSFFCCCYFCQSFCSVRVYCVECYLINSILCARSPANIHCSLHPSTPPATLSPKIYLQFVLFVFANANFKIRFCYSNGERNNKLQNETSKNNVDYELLRGS